MFFCLVEFEYCSVPHMEPMPVDTLDEARVLARRLLTEHAPALAAHIFRGDVRLDILEPDPEAKWPVQLRSALRPGLRSAISGHV